MDESWRFTYDVTTRLLTLVDSGGVSGTLNYMLEFSYNHNENGS